MSRVEVIGNATLHLGDCLAIMPSLAPVGHILTDPPYERITHDAKNARTIERTDGRSLGRGIDFAAIDDIRAQFVAVSEPLCGGWFIAFCTSEGVGRWADVINASRMKYKRACVWVKPDSTPQMNGQGPAQGAEHFVAAWAGKGYARWNAGGKRGVYTHLVNQTDRHGAHPTEKPRRLMAEIVFDFTGADDVILDPFMGSGTTGVAAVQLGRPFVGIEMNETYFDIACQRLEAAQRQGVLFGAAA